MMCTLGWKSGLWGLFVKISSVQEHVFQFFYNSSNFHSVCPKALCFGFSDSHLSGFKSHLYVCHIICGCKLLIKGSVIAYHVMCCVAVSRLMVRDCRFSYNLGKCSIISYYIRCVWIHWFTKKVSSIFNSIGILERIITQTLLTGASYMAGFGNVRNKSVTNRIIIVFLYVELFGLFLDICKNKMLLVTVFNPKTSDKGKGSMGGY